MTEAAAARVVAQPTVVEVQDLEFCYDGKPALSGISFAVEAGEIFGVLGPNGGGKTTLFRLLSTLAPPQKGVARVLGHDLATERAAVRDRLGVVFQNPSVDGKLTVYENLRYHGLLYGLNGAQLRSKAAAALQHLGLSDRAHEYVETLSGGLRRRVELAKALITDPQVLILDEPSTGLDPGARIDLWRYLRSLRDARGTTILLTTHAMDEAEQCDRLAILDRGRIVSTGTPDALRKRIGGDIVTIRAVDPDELAEKIFRRFGERPTKLGEALRLERADGHIFIRQLVETFPNEVQGVSLGKPTLEDVFVHETGHRFWSEA